jgi:excisionase family DNA binding protein
MATTHDANTTDQLIQLLKRNDLAKTLNCSLRTIDNLQAKGMPCVRLGRSRRFIATEVIAWLKRTGGAL